MEIVTEDADANGGCDGNKNEDNDGGNKCRQ